MKIKCQEPQPLGDDAGQMLGELRTLPCTMAWMMIWMENGASIDRK